MERKRTSPLLPLVLASSISLMFGLTDAASAKMPKHLLRRHGEAKDISTAAAAATDKQDDSSALKSQEPAAAQSTVAETSLQVETLDGSIVRSAAATPLAGAAPNPLATYVPELAPSATVAPVSGSASSAAVAPVPGSAPSAALAPVPGAASSAAVTQSPVGETTEAAALPPGLNAPASADVPLSVPEVAPAQRQESAVASLPTTVPTLPPSVIYIDNDDEVAASEVETFSWDPVADKAGNTVLSTGIRFPVRVVSQINSKTAKVGDPVEGLTKVDITIGGKLIAPKGTRVVGHVFSAQGARRILAAEISRKRWFRANGELGLQFDEIITKDNMHIPLMAKPARQSRIVENKNEGRVMGVNNNGEIASPLSIQLKHQALHLAIRGAASVGGVFSMGAVPVAYAAIGALNPDFAFLRPTGQNMHHRRLKGAAMGFVSGVPGGFLIADTIIKGAEASVKPGDEFLVELKQDFTGEAATDAQLMPNADTKVHGEIVKKKSK